jgi:hypothetical protein
MRGLGRRMTMATQHPPGVAGAAVVRVEGHAGGELAAARTQQI